MKESGGMRLKYVVYESTRAPIFVNGAMPAFRALVAILSHQSPFPLINENVRRMAGVFACIFHFKSLRRLWYTNGEYGFSWLVMGIAFHK